MSFPPPKNSPPTGSPVKKAAPPVKSGPKPPPVAKAKGPPVSSAFQGPPGGSGPQSPSAGAPQPQGQSTPMAAPTDVASNLAHLTGKAIAQAILGGFAQQIAQPK